jgi:RNA polymerase sigma-70 factor (ECF subfamily)
VQERERGTEDRGSSLEALAARAARGDRAAFEALVTRTTPRLYRLAARITGDPGEAEDALQDAFLRAFDALSDGRFDQRSGIETWLYRIVANAALDSLRARRRRRARVDLDPEGSSEGAPVDDGGRLAARAALRELDTWMEELPADQRTAIVLKEIEGLSSNEVAEIMKCSVGAVEQRLVRARATLRRRSGEGDG